MEDKLPKVSIIIPVYDGSRYMREAIDSALTQTYQNIEVLVVNDGSNDDGKTKGIALSYGNKIKYFEKENGGVSTALNLAVKNMTGDYFSWLSHDDSYLPQKIEMEMDYLSSNGLIGKNVIIYADYYLIDRESKIINECIMDHNQLSEKPIYALLRGAVNGLTLLIPKKAFDEHGLFDEGLRCTQDYMMWHKMMKTYDFIHIPQTLVKSRYHSAQQSKVNPKVLAEGNSLWIMMISNLSKADKEKLEGSEYLFYLTMRNFLKTTPYKEAENHCSFMLKKIEAEKKKNMDLDTILVTVIIPFYNRPDETMRAIKSVLVQTHKNWQILLINDGSTEDIAIIEDFIKGNTKINLVNLEKNHGPAEARNVGMKMSQGEYIAFLDSDDEFLPQKIAAQLSEMLISDANISHTSYVRRIGNKETIVNSGMDSGDVKRKMIYSCGMATPTVMIKRKYLVDNQLHYDPTIKIGEDVCLWLSVLKGSALIGIDKPLTIVNTSGNNSAYDDKKQLEGTKNILRFLVNDGFYSQYDLEIANLVEYYIHLARKNRIVRNSSQKRTYFQRLKNSFAVNGFAGTFVKVCKKIKGKLTS